MKRFRGRFIGKTSPVHFFWGSFDHAYTRFSGRRAPRHPGGAPNCPDYVMVEAADPDAALLEFFQSTYDAAADLAQWDRAGLERARRDGP